MRIRTIKPEIRSDEIVCSWDFPVRWTFAGLISYVDDDGRGRDDTRLLKADLYPIDDKITPRIIEKHLCTIAGDGPLCRYTADGKSYLHLVNWKHQRINRRTASVLPACPIHDKDVSTQRSLTEHAVSPHHNGSEDAARTHGVVTEGVHRERKGREGKGKTLAPAAPPRERDELFEALVATVGWDPTQLTSSARGSVNNALKQLREVEATPNQLKVRARRFRDRFRDATLTPSALAKHWASLGESAGNVDDSRRRPDPNGPNWPGYDPLNKLGGGS